MESEDEMPVMGTTSAFPYIKHFTEEEVKRAIQEFADKRDEAKKKQERHKEYCPYCRGETYDDKSGNCIACGGPRGREKNEPKKESKAYFEEFQPYFIGSQPYYADGGIPQETEDERIKRVLEWTARCEQEEHRNQQEMRMREIEQIERNKKAVKFILLTAFWLTLLLLFLDSGGLEWLSRVPQ
jgi:hypothetical protein